MGGGDGEIGVWYTGVLGGIFMKISAMNETVCNHLFRDTPWRVSVRLTKTDRRGNLGVLRTISNSSWQNGLDASVLENKGFTTFISGGGVVFLFQ